MTIRPVSVANPRCVLLAVMPTPEGSRVRIVGIRPITNIFQRGKIDYPNEVPFEF
jgi:hypothetical protein